MSVSGVKHIAIVGTGMIGSSQSALFTGNGYRTTMYAVNQAEADKGLRQYRSFFETLIERNLVTRDQAKKCESYLTVTQSYSDIADADIVYECVPEDLDLKHRVYRDIEQNCTNFKVLASTTSAKSADDLAEGLSEHKDKLMVAHPFFPPHLILFVEIVKGKATSDSAARLLYDVLESCGRKPIIANKSVPGFVANRLQHALLREAGYMVDEGIASPEDVDRALTYSFAPRYAAVGLFQHMDAAGLDMVKSIQDYLLPSLSTRTDTPDVITEHFKKGELGMKTGSGIYDWPEEKQQQFHQAAAEPYFSYFNWNIPE